MSKLYEFTIYPVGWGDTPEEAWENCKEAFDINLESLPVNQIIDED